MHYKKMEDNFGIKAWTFFMHLLNAQKVRKTHRLWVLRAYATSRFGKEC